MSESGTRWMKVATPPVTARVDIHHLSGTIESWELPGDGPFLFPIDAQGSLGLIKDMAKSRIFYRKQAWFLPPNVQRCQDGTDAD